MGDIIKYSKEYLDMSAVGAKQAVEFMNSVVNNAGSTIASIPSDFSQGVSAASAVNGLKNICAYADVLPSTYNEWKLLMDEYDLDPDQISIFDLGYGPLYVNFDNNIPIAVVSWGDYSTDGRKFPIDQYVMGVMDAEEIRGWGSLCYHGEITVEQFFTAAKVFSIIARSYGLYQTVHSPRHHDDLKISDTGTDKQAFKERLFDYELADYKKGWPLYTTVTAAAVLETTGMVIGNSEKPFNTRYTAGKNAKILEYAIEGKDYISILKLQYPEFFEGDGGLKYYDYKTRKVVGNVPDDTEISELIGVNLSKDKASAIPTKWTYQLTSDGRIVTVAANNFNDGTPFTSQINFTDSTLGQKNNIFATPTPSPTPTPTPTVAPTATPTPTATPKGTSVTENGIGIGVSPTATPKPTTTPTSAPTATPKATTTPKVTPTPTAAPTATPKATSTPVATPTAPPSTTPTNDSTTPKKTPNPVGGPTNTPTATPTSTPTSGSSSTNDYNELREELFDLKNKKPEPVAEEPKEEPTTPPVKDEPKQPDPKPADPTPTTPSTPEPTYILPENKFSEILPNFAGGNLDSMEISMSHVNYELSGITDEMYNNYINSIKEAGYTLGADGSWISGNYILNLVRNNTDLNIYFKLN